MFLAASSIDDSGDMPDAEATPSWRDYVVLEDAALLAQCEVDRFRASGPGGQKRNKTDSAVRLRHRPTGLESIAVESRSQHENRARALKRLRLEIALRTRHPHTLAAFDAFEPSSLLRSRLRGGRVDVSTRHADFPAIVGEVFDVLETSGWRISDAAPVLGLSTAACGRFLESDPVVFRAANERRAALGLGALHAGR